MIIIYSSLSQTSRTGSESEATGSCGLPTHTYVFPRFSASPMALMTLSASYTRLRMLSFYAMSESSQAVTFFASPVVCSCTSVSAIYPSDENRRSNICV